MSKDAPPSPTPPQCACGQDLREWRYTRPEGKATGVWCAGLADLVNYQSNRRTQHDVYDLRGRRVQRGQCATHRDYRSDGPP
jgi:hypothetical protein